MSRWLVNYQSTVPTYHLILSWPLLIESITAIHDPTTPPFYSAWTLMTAWSGRCLCQSWDRHSPIGRLETATQWLNSWTSGSPSCLTGYWRTFWSSCWCPGSRERWRPGTPPPIQYPYTDGSIRGYHSCVCTCNLCTVLVCSVANQLEWNLWIEGTLKTDKFSPVYREVVLFIKSFQNCRERN